MGHFDTADAREWDKIGLNMLTIYTAQSKHVFM